METTAPLSGLFAPFSFSGLTLSNRFVMAPMTRRFSPGGVPGADVAAYYAGRAAAGVGLVITEGTYVDLRPAAVADIPAPGTTRCSWICWLTSSGSERRPRRPARINVDPAIRSRGSRVPGAPGRRPAPG
jgi:hypothetical protein